MGCVLRSCSNLALRKAGSRFSKLQMQFQRRDSNLIRYKYVLLSDDPSSWALFCALLRTERTFLDSEK